MTLVKYNSKDYRPVKFNSLIDRFFNEDYFGGREHANFSPSVDVAETDKEFELQFHLPGMKKDEIAIDINDDRITVSGERKMENEKNEKNFHSVESYYGSFSRAFHLPAEVNTDKIEASYKEGILNVRIPKDEKKILKRTISIK